MVSSALHDYKMYWNTIRLFTVEHDDVTKFSALLAICEGNPPVTGGFPTTKASDAELWRLLWPVPKQMVEEAIETPAIWDAIALIMTSL